MFFNREVTIMFAAAAACALFGLGPLLVALLKRNFAATTRQTKRLAEEARRRDREVVEMVYPDNIVVRVTWKKAILLDDGLLRAGGPRQVAGNLYEAYTGQEAPEPVRRYFAAFEA